MSDGAPFHGVMVVDKPTGPTSHDIVARCRRLFGTRHIGHAGTLDPMASGVLVVLLGEACKLSGYLTAADKTYLARVTFGVRTTSFDADGDVVERVAVDRVSPDALLAALELERQRAEQIPPEVSAVRLDGERAYRRARRGEAMTLAPRPVRVLSLQLCELAGVHADIEVSVSKGYYVRSLARDLGSSVGLPAHLSRLRRVRSGAFTLDDAGPWPPAASPALELAAPTGQRDEPSSKSAPAWPPAGWIELSDAARRSLPWAVLTSDGVDRARKGQRLGAEHFVCRPAAESGSQVRGVQAAGPGAAPEPDRVDPPTPSRGAVAWFSESGALVALGSEKEDGCWKVIRGFIPLPSPDTHGAVFPVSLDKP